MNLEILTPEEIREKIRIDKEEERKSLIKLRLEAICKNMMRHLQNAELGYLILSKELLDEKLSDYYGNFPSKSIKELLEEKGWVVQEIDYRDGNLSYRISSGFKK